MEERGEGPFFLSSLQAQQALSVAHSDSLCFPKKRAANQRERLPRFPTRRNLFKGRTPTDTRCGFRVDWKEGLHLTFPLFVPSGVFLKMCA